MFLVVSYYQSCFHSDIAPVLILNEISERVGYRNEYAEKPNVYKMFLN